MHSRGFCELKTTRNQCGRETVLMWGESMLGEQQSSRAGDHHQIFIECLLYARHWGYKEV